MCIYIYSDKSFDLSVPTTRYYSSEGTISDTPTWVLYGGKFADLIWIRFDTGSVAISSGTHRKSENVRSNQSLYLVSRSFQKLSTQKSRIHQPHPIVVNGLGNWRTWTSTKYLIFCELVTAPNFFRFITFDGTWDPTTMVSMNYNAHLVHRRCDVPNPLKFSDNLLISNRPIIYHCCGYINPCPQKHTYISFPPDSIIPADSQWWWFIFQVLHTQANTHYIYIIILSSWLTDCLYVSMKLSDLANCPGYK